MSLDKPQMQPTPTIAIPQRSPARLSERWKLPSQKMEKLNPVLSSPTSTISDSSFDDEVDSDSISNKSEESLFSNEKQKVAQEETFPNQCQVLQLNTLKNLELEGLMQEIEQSEICKIDEIVEIVGMYTSMENVMDTLKLR